MKDRIVTYEPPGHPPYRWTGVLHEAGCRHLVPTARRPYTSEAVATPHQLRTGVPCGHC